ncbi:sulfatase [uncultured Gimesia sp.]|uniref:sulfatase n=1 Tax=uncultured Gimesia sp. TaxID=1678688 RepID=UPI0030D9F9F6|tara:strand:+ start:182814 stop:184217 length:1404 start_codon:yes stop_codon:yes gene_type:complete
MRRFLVVGLLFCWNLTPAIASTDRPNIVLFFIDDLGWRDVGFMGSDFFETPHIDHLAQESMQFSSAYSAAPNCAPSRACLMSGQYTPRHGVYTVGDPARGNNRYRRLIPAENKTVLNDKFVTIADTLSKAGYRCASVGKWHLGQTPLSQGFQVNIAGNPSGSPRGGYFSPYRNPQLADGKQGEFLTDRLTDEACAFIKANTKSPFFLYLTHYAVHTPLQAKQDDIEYFQSKPAGKLHQHATYAAMIKSMDQSIGRVLKTLKTQQLEQNTIIIFTSDNGGYGPATSMQPLRGSKGMLYEGGIRVPLLVKWPGVTKAGSASEEPVINIDLYPTLLEMTETSQPENYPLDGESLVPILKDPQSQLKSRSLFWHFPAYLQKYKGMQQRFRTTPVSVIRQGDWKLLEFFEDGHLELYNTRLDIGESMNLADSHPKKAKELATALREWQKQVRAAIPSEPNPQYRSGNDSNEK